MSERKPWVKALLCAVFVGMCILVGFLFRTKMGVSAERKQAVGEQVVKLLYEFSSADSLELQQSKLAMYTTEDVYNQLSTDNLEHTIRTYVWYDCSWATVNFLRCTDSYVVFSMNSDYTTPDQHFIFMFEVDSKGRICYAREAEIDEFFDCDY